MRDFSLKNKCLWSLTSGGKIEYICLERGNQVSGMTGRIHYASQADAFDQDCMAYSIQTKIKWINSMRF